MEALDVLPGDVAVPVGPDTVPLVVRVGIGCGEVNGIMDDLRLVQARLGLVHLGRLHGDSRSAQGEKSDKEGLGGNHVDSLKRLLFVQYEEKRIALNVRAMMMMMMRVGLREGGSPLYIHLTS